eukprot:gene17621-5519_t
MGPGPRWPSGGSRAASLQGTNPDKTMRKLPDASSDVPACKIPVLDRNGHKTGRVFGRKLMRSPIH